MVTLICAIVGSPEVFGVKLDVIAEVWELQDAIKEEEENDLAKVDADKLQLLLAKTADGAWLTEADVKSGVDTTGLKLLDVARAKLRREGLSDEDVGGVDDDDEEEGARGRGAVHVLVKLPPEATSDELTIGSDQWRSILGDLGDLITSKVNAAFEEQKIRARECVAMSRISSKKRQTMLNVLRLPVEVVEFKEPEVTRKHKIPVFQWDPILDEHKQVLGDKGNKKYLADHFNYILKPRGLRFEHVEGNKSLLDTVDERLPFDLSGGADVLVLKDLGDFTAENVHHLNGLRLVIEMKKDLEQDFNKKEAQSIAELIAVNLRAPDKSAVVLLTNLRNWWIFMWLSEDSKIRKFTVKEPTNAAAVIDAIVSREDLSIRIPFPRAPRLPLRGKLDEMIASEEGDILEEMVARYRAIASELGPDMSMAREIGWQVVKQMPAYTSMYT